MSWTDANTAVVTKLWAEGKSAAAIAKVINAEFETRFSRNAVIGKVHRMGLPGRAKPSRPSLARKAKPPIRRSRPKGRALRLNGETGPRTVSHVKPKTAEVNAKAVNDGRGVTLLDIEDGQCRFPCLLYTSPSPRDRG